MPIKIQSDLPAREILDNENIFVMDEYRAMHQNIRPLQIYSESDAGQTGYGAAASSVAVQYAAAGGRDLYENEQPSVSEYLCNTSE